MAKPKLYSFDDHPEHKAQLDATRDHWIANALNCAPMTEQDREATRAAMAGLYRAANLEVPRVGLFVSSPLVGAIACSIASGAWWLRDNARRARRRRDRATTASQRSHTARRVGGGAPARQMKGQL